MEPFDVPAHGEAQVEFEVHPDALGPFRCDLSVPFYDRGLYVERTATVRGTWVAPRSETHDSAKSSP